MGKSKDKDFDRFVDAIRESGLQENDSAEEGSNSETMPLTHTSGVSPRDWERVQKSLEADQE